MRIHYVFTATSLHRSPWEKRLCLFCSFLCPQCLHQCLALCSHCVCEWKSSCILPLDSHSTHRWNKELIRSVEMRLLNCAFQTFMTTKPSLLEYPLCVPWETAQYSSSLLLFTTPAQWASFWALNKTHLSFSMWPPLVPRVFFLRLIMALMSPNRSTGGMVCIWHDVFWFVHAPGVPHTEWDPLQMVSNFPYCSLELAPCNL